MKNITPLAALCLVALLCSPALARKPVKPPPPPPPPNGGNGPWVIYLDASAFVGDAEAVRQGVQDAYSPFNATVTLTKPTGGNFKTCTLVTGPSPYGGLTPVVGGPICYVYLDNFGGNVRWIKDAIVHEIGHCFGLLHQHGPNGEEYYAGDGTYAPFMGLPYYARARWWISSGQNDLSILDSVMGRKADDYGSTAATASGILGSVGGVIERADDEDWFNVPVGDIASLTLPDNGMLVATLEQTGTLVRVRGDGSYNDVGSYTVSLSSFAPTVPEPGVEWGLVLIAIRLRARRAPSCTLRGT